MNKVFDLKIIDSTFGVNYKLMTFAQRSYFYNLFSINLIVQYINCEDGESSSESSDDNSQDNNQDKVTYLYF